MKPIVGAPEWLKERMRKLRQRPPPSLEEVRQSFAASADHGSKVYGHGKRRWREKDGVQPGPDGVLR